MDLVMGGNPRLRTKETYQRQLVTDIIYQNLEPKGVCQSYWFQALKTILFF